MSDVILHLNEEIGHDAREKLRDLLLNIDGVMAADVHDERPHLMIIDYDPNIVESMKFVEVAADQGLHSQLVGL